MMMWATSLRAHISIVTAALDGHQGPAFIFGGHVNTQYVVSGGEARFISVIDNDPRKHGQRLYGSDLTVKPASILKDLQNPLVVVRSGAYTDEIRIGLLALNPNIIFPLVSVTGQLDTSATRSTLPVISIAVLVTTHTSYSDVWPLTLLLLERFAVAPLASVPVADVTFYWCANEIIAPLPS